ncbi:hypothetical protein CLV30_106135 [Haloactinopolyspora alba]|uniref:Gp19/Gp15/Gp42-like protein n=1 Tax=Haloactinopolyspora alba TaxID=648780 RepID=A0A2P8E3T6_9ACTN|nr:hypothetical protein [Haloactinopolyspora alba]PSL04130.1 hypothetical protein CLV30_106135 [Haloactinopolyspora alba]
MDSLVTLEALEGKLDRILDEDEQRDAEGALEEASMLVRYYGAPWPDPATAPAVARILVIRSVKRYLKNTDGYSQSRAGDETVAWEEAHPAPYLTDAEQKMAASAAGRGGIQSAPISPWGELRSRRDEYVPVVGSSEPFPFHAAEDDW